MSDCPTPRKQQFRSKRAAARAYRRSTVKPQLFPYLCPAGEHWHLTSHTPAQQRTLTTAGPMGIDRELHVIAVRAADRYPDSLLTAQGWTRTELVDAIHQRLRNKYRAMRNTGQLERDDDGQIRIST